MSYTTLSQSFTTFEHAVDAHVTLDLQDLDAEEIAALYPEQCARELLEHARKLVVEVSGDDIASHETVYGVNDYGDLVDIDDAVDHRRFVDVTHLDLECAYEAAISWARESIS